MTYELSQGIIAQYVGPRLVNVIQMPDHYMIINVRLPQILCNQTKPGVGSTVLIAAEDSYKSYVVAVIRESRDYIKKDGYLRASTDDERDWLQPGEVFMETYGDPASQVPGLGATFYMGNNGTITMASGQMNEYITVGGRDQDEDHEVIVNGDNMHIQSNVDDITNTQSTFNFSDLATIQIANQIVTTPDSSPIAVKVPVCELTMDLVGNIVLRNTTAGVTKSQLKLDVLGNITLQNLASSMTFSEAGAVALNGVTVNINNGTFGAARLNDLTLSNPATDGSFWSFIQTLFTIFNLHTHVSAAPGQPTSPPATPLVSFPTQMIGKINQGSTTVSIGG